MIRNERGECSCSKYIYIYIYRFSSIAPSVFLSSICETDKKGYDEFGFYWCESTTLRNEAVSINWTLMLHDVAMLLHTALRDRLGCMVTYYVRGQLIEILGMKREEHSCE